MKTHYKFNGSYAPTFEAISKAGGAVTDIRTKADKLCESFLPKHSSLGSMAAMHWKQCCERAAMYLAIKDEFPEKALEWVELSSRAHGDPGVNGAARRFAEEMESSGTADMIREEEGNLRYQYFQPLDDPETVLLIDSWRDQAAIDAHHASPMMQTITALREKYDLHMKVERFVGAEDNIADDKFIRK